MITGKENEKNKQNNMYHRSSSVASKVSKPRVTKPAKVKNVRATSTYALRTTVKWNRVSGAAGYKVYRSTGSSYKCVKTVKSGSTLKYTDKIRFGRKNILLQGESIQKGKRQL